MSSPARGAGAKFRLKAHPFLKKTAWPNALLPMSQLTLKISGGKLIIAQIKSLNTPARWNLDVLDILLIDYAGAASS